MKTESVKGTKVDNSEWLTPEQFEVRLESHLKKQHEAATDTLMKLEAQLMNLRNEAQRVLDSGKYAADAPSVNYARGEVHAYQRAIRCVQVARGIVVEGITK